MATKKIKLTSQTAWETQKDLNDNFADLETRIDELDIPEKTSDLTNDGDGTSAFATQSYVQQYGGKIDSISVNGTPQTIDANKNVDITVPIVDSTLNASSTNAIQNKAVAELIPSQATTSNQLADKEFVNSSIATNTATFRGTYNLVNELFLPTSATHAQIEQALNAEPIDPDNNDYCFVQIPTSDATPTQIASVERYKFVQDTADPEMSTWDFEYELNNSGFTASQWEAINSGITSSLVSKLTNLNADDISDATTTNKFVTTAEKATWNAKQDALVNISFTASDAGWSAIDANGFYTLTIVSTKKPLAVYNSNGEQVLAGLKSDGTNVYVVTDTKFAGVVTVK